MKKILLFILFSTLYSAQNPDMLNTNWSITKIVNAAGAQTFPPPMPYQQNSTFSTVYPQLSSSFFNTAAGELTYIGQNSFLVNFSACTLADYWGDNGAVNQFFNFICTFYFRPGTFSYTIQNNGTQKSMVITNSLFEEIHFSAAVLKTKQAEVSQFNITPNPVRNMVKITNFLPIHFYKIFDQSGRVIEERKDLNTKNLQIDMQNYQTGIYYISINDGKSIKFIKK